MTSTSSASRRFAIWLAVSVALMVASVLMVLPVARASAASNDIPFKDPNAIGTITFCDRHNHPVTSGQLTDKPFVWKSIASSRAPQGYDKRGAGATLYAYQPIQNVDPGDWSGEQMTGATTFDNPAHPVSQSTNGDRPLIDFTGAFPPHWHGLVQLRFLYTGVNAAPYGSQYPAAVVRVSGGTWTMLSQSTTSCAAGGGMAREASLLNPKKLKKPRAVTLLGPDGKPVPSPSESSGTSGPGNRSGGASDTAADPKAHQVAASHHSAGLSSSAQAGIGLGALAVIAGAVLGAIVWRRSRQENQSM